MEKVNKTELTPKTPKAKKPIQSSINVIAMYADGISFTGDQT